MKTAFTVDASVLEIAPRRWDRKPLWALVRRRDITGMPDAELLSVYRDHGVVPKSSRDDNFNKPSEDLSSYRYVRPGDLVLNKMKTWQGSLAVSRHEGIVSPAYYVCELSPNLHPRFAHYLLRSQPYIHLYRSVSKGIRPNQWDLPYEDFTSLPALVPPLEEQHRIADFLDAETSRIDRLVQLQSAVLEKLDERNAAVRDSSIDELAKRFGEIPLRRFVRGVEQGTSPQCYAMPREEDSEWAVLKLSAVKSGTFNPGENKKLPDDIDAVSTYEVKEGDLLVTRANTPSLVGDVAVVTAGCEHLLLPDLIYRLRLFPQVCSEYVAQVALSGRVRAIIEATARGTSQSMVKLRGEDIKSWPIPPASLKEQNILVDRLSQGFDKSLKLRSLISQQITLLTERRKSLITAAVIGQFDVTTASGRNITQGV